MANLTLDRWPREHGQEPAWDNVFFDSPSLGYVVATHQSLAIHQERTVWTFYWALAEGAPSRNRELLLAKDWHYWKEAVLGDLERAHSGYSCLCDAAGRLAVGTRHDPARGGLPIFGRTADGGASPRKCAVLRTRI